MNKDPVSKDTDERIMNESIALTRCFTVTGVQLIKIAHLSLYCYVNSVRKHK